MKICIPTEDPRGLEARLSGHFGEAPYFTLIDANTEGVEVVPNPRVGHGHGGCGLPNELHRLGVDAVLCGGLGRRALIRLRELGVSVIATREEHVAGALAALRAGRLARHSLEQACAGGHKACDHDES